MAKPCKETRVNKMIDGLCWPKELLKLDVKNCRIFTWSYDSNVANITTSASNATIFGHAESFLQDIAMTRESMEEVIALSSPWRRKKGLSI